MGMHTNCIDVYLLRFVVTIARYEKENSDVNLHYYAGSFRSGKRTATVWCLSVRLHVCLSRFSKLMRL